MKQLKWIAGLAIALSVSTSNAADIDSALIVDNYIGKGHDDDVKGRDSIYDTEKMIVTRNGSQITVDIYTNYTGSNIGHNGTGLGDLFMSTNVLPIDAPWKPNSDNDTFANTNWNYAYKVYDADRQQQSGRGYLATNFNNGLVYTTSDSHRKGQVYALNYNHLDKIGNTNNWSSDAQKISFSFNVAGTALESANQIAFRWAMSCANDIIEGLVSITDPNVTPVPEPETIALFGLALAGLAYRRKQSS